MLWAFDAYNGKQLWNFSEAGSIDDTPIYEGGFIYISSWDLNVNKTFKINATTGKAVWNHTMNGKGGGILYNNGYTYTMGADKCIVYALNDTNGVELWNFTKKESCYAATALSLHGDILFFETSGVPTSQHLFAINKTNGLQIWNLSSGFSYWDSAVSIDNTTGIAYAC